MKSEADVKKAVRVALKAAGWFFWMPGANGYGTQGVSDFIALKNGQLLVIETKFGANKPTALQETFLNNIQAHGGMCMVVTEQNVKDFGGWLNVFEKMRSSQKPQTQ